MIITYLTRTHDGRPAGTAIDNSGVSSWLNGELDEAAVERVVTANLGDTPRDAVDYVHVTDPDLQQQCLTHRHHVERGRVVVDEPHPPPEPPEPSERDKAAERIKAAKRMDDVDLDDLKLVLGVD